MRVLVVTNTFPPGYTGGAEISNYHTCRGLRKRGIDCSILVLNNRRGKTVDEWYEFDGIPVHRAHVVTKKRTAWRDVFDPRIYRAVRTALRKLQPDLVHVHNVSGTTLAPYLACRQVGVPVVNTLHDLWLLCPNNMLYRKDGSFCDPKQYPRGCGDCFRRYDYWGDIVGRRRIFSLLTANVSYFISPSQAIIDRHVEAGYARERFRLVRLGFENPGPQRPQHPTVRAVVEMARRYQVIVFAGGGVEIKGACVLLEAIPMLLAHIDRLRMVVAGGGDKRFLDQFRRYAPAVQVLGKVPFREMRTLFGAGDLTILPSVWHENSPVVIFESFQRGTPVLASKIGGIPEFIQENRTGYLFPPASASALAEKAILHFARSAVERRRMRQTCYRYVDEELAFKQHIEGILTAYDEVLGY